MNRTQSPSRKPLRGMVAPPGDKSLAHRALILGALAQGELEVRNLPRGADVASTRACLEALGVVLRGGGEALSVRGVGLDGLRRPAGDLDCGNSGTTMRLLMGVLAGQPFDSVLAGDASLSRRPMERVAFPLRKMGAAIELSAGGTAPVRIRGKRPLLPMRYRLPVPSAQVKSAVLLAGLFAEGATSVEDRFGTRDHTERMLRHFGTPRPKTDQTLTLPGDPSSGAFFAAAAALVADSDVVLKALLLNKTRLGFFDALKRMGVEVVARLGGEVAGESVGDVSVRPGALRGIVVRSTEVPALIDEVPLLAVLAANAQGDSRFEGVGELRVKESDRLAGIVDGLRALGGRAEIEGDDLIVRGRGALDGGAVETLGDHRLAMAFGVAALAARGPVELSDAECARISYPGFFERLEELQG